MGLKKRKEEGTREHYSKKTTVCPNPVLLFLFLFLVFLYRWCSCCFLLLLCLLFFGCFLGCLFVCCCCDACFFCGFGVFTSVCFVFFALLLVVLDLPLGVDREPPEDSWLLIYHAWFLIYHAWLLIYHAWFLIYFAWFLIYLGGPEGPTR